MAVTELTSANVDEICGRCLFGEEDRQDDPDYVEIEGILHRYAFSKKALAANRDKIVSMVDQLDPTFFEGSGGGWTFLNLCVDKNGNQWTGLHLSQERLCCLAIGVDYGAFCGPRSLWSKMYGGMPYVVFGENVTGRFSVPSST